MSSISRENTAPKGELEAEPLQHQAMAGMGSR